MDGVSESVQPRISYAYIDSLYRRLWLIARVIHNMLCIHAVRKIRKLPRSRAECRLFLFLEKLTCYCAAGGLSWQWGQRGVVWAKGE
jgi:hypothetical protein